MAVNCDSADLWTLYAETRQTEKRVAVARLELEQQCEQTRQQVAEIAEAKVQMVRRLQQQALEELRNIRDTLTASREWENFQKYAQEVRKMHLGGSSIVVLPAYKREGMNTYLKAIESSKVKLEVILGEFSQQMNTQSQSGRNQLSRQLSFNALTAHSERILDKIRTEPSFEISPIKRKQDLPTSNLPEKDNALPHPKILPVTNNSVKQAKMGSSTLLAVDCQPSTRNHLKKSEIKLTSSIFPANTAYSPPQTSSIAPSSLRSPPNFQFQQKTVKNGQGTTTMRSSSKNLSKVKSQSRLLSPGHSGLLQMLQMQQLRFDKLKHGLP